MNHDRTFAVTRLRNMALLFERGEMDQEFAAAIEAGVDIGPLRETMTRRLRELADALDGAA
jgi:hypothetical protein